jgi:hypothetical protein
MIEVEIKNDGVTLATIEITRMPTRPRLVSEEPNEFSDYKIHYKIERGTAAGLHKRIIYGFPRKYYNVFALVLQSLNALNEKDLKLERDFDPDEAPVSTDMARRFDRALRPIQRRKR